MPLGADAVDGGLDAGVEQFNNHDDHHRTRQQRHFDPAMTQPERQRNQDDGRKGFLAKRFFVPAGTQPCDGVTGGMPDAVQPGPGLLGVGRCAV